MKTLETGIEEERRLRENLEKVRGICSPIKFLGTCEAGSVDAEQEDGVESARIVVSSQGEGDVAH